jgi:hypothetical protein
LADYSLLQKRDTPVIPLSSTEQKDVRLRQLQAGRRGAAAVIHLEVAAGCPQEQSEKEAQALLGQAWYSLQTPETIRNRFWNTGLKTSLIQLSIITINSSIEK